MISSKHSAHIVRFVKYCISVFFCRCKFLLFDSRNIIVCCFSQLMTNNFAMIRIFAFGEDTAKLAKKLYHSEKLSLWFELNSTDLLCSACPWCFFYSINYNNALLSFAVNFTNGCCKLIYNVSHVLHFCLLLRLFLFFSLHYIRGKLQFLC